LTHTPKVVSQADARGDFLSGDQLDALGRVVADGLKRIDAVNRMTGSASKIVLTLPVLCLPNSLS
jgi:phycocyanin beta chain